MERLKQELWSIAKDIARAFWRTLLWNLRTYAQTFSIMVGLFYFWASYLRVPHGHLLNWPEFHAVLGQTIDHFMSRLYAGGCSQ